MPDARGVLAKLRRAEALSADDAAWFGAALATGQVTDAQAGAFTMGVCRAPMGEAARVALTTAMRDSGKVLKWDLPGPVVDKHSTGGLGDSVSFLLAPALAACGVFNPMISGRGLGHTGGTLDKLEAIPDLIVDQSEEDFRRITRDVSTAIVSASGDFAPSDKRLYAVRDVTSTVESIDLITASILSKKLAAGLDALILDVKSGSGAFMKTPEDAQALAQSLVETANGAGCKTAALITDMNEPLMGSVGNAVEVAACMRALTGSPDDPRIVDVTVALAGKLLELVTGEDGSDRVRAAIDGGRAAEVFARMLTAQGAPADFVDRWAEHLPTAPVQRDVSARTSGSVADIDGTALGMAVVRLGGGRMKDGDPIDHAVGLTDLLRLGTKVSTGDRLAQIHARTAEAADAAEAAVLEAITVGDAPEIPPLVHGEVT